MGNELFQARLDDEFAEEVHEYRENRHMSKSEVVRQGLRHLLNAEASDGTDTDSGVEAEAEESRIRRLAGLGEKFAYVGALLALLSIIVPLTAATVVNTYSLTVGQFGTYLIVGISAVSFVAAVGCAITGGLFIIEALIRYGIAEGYVGRTLDHYIGRGVPA